MTPVRPRRPRLRLDPESYRKLCQQVLERDGWCCQRCGSSTNLQVHHVNLRSRLGDDDDAAELEHPEEVGFVELPASYEPTEVMQPSEKAFDFPATTVTAQLATVLGQIQAVGAVGRDHANAVLAPQLAVQGVAVVGRIADHSFRPSTGETVLEGAFDEFRFMRRSAGKVAGDRKTMAVCDRHDFTAFTSASRADSSAPFFAELKLASMKVSDKSSLPRARRSSARACKSRVRVPSRCHCWKRRWQV